MLQKNVCAQLGKGCLTCSQKQFQTIRQGGRSHLLEKQVWSTYWERTKMLINWLWQCEFLFYSGKVLFSLLFALLIVRAVRVKLTIQPLNMLLGWCCWQALELKERGRNWQANSACLQADTDPVWLFWQLVGQFDFIFYVLYFFLFTSLL